MSEGVLAALTAALGWTVATALFRDAGRQLPPLELNLLKGLLASLAMSLVLVLLQDPPQLPAGWLLYLLLLSGVVGIGIGDTAYFKALGRLGVRRTLLMELLAAPIAAVASWLFLTEILGLKALAGILLTLGGVALVVLYQQQKGDTLQQRQSIQALAWGLLAAGCQGSGAVMAREVLRQTDISPLAAALLRLLAGLVLILVLLAGRKGLVRRLKGLDKRFWRLLLAATFVGTFLGLWLQQVSLEQLPAGIAQTLLSTSPLFAMLLARFRGYPVRPLAWLGTILSMAGIMLLTL